MSVPLCLSSKGTYKKINENNMEAIVLNRRDVREYDQMVTLYTREKGKIEVLARGVKKSVSKNAAFLEPFFLVDAEFVEGKEKDHLIRVYPLKCFDRIRESFVMMQLLGYSVELFRETIPGQEPDTKLFDFLITWINFLNGPEAPLQMVDAFIIRLWGRLGFSIALDKCVICGKEERKALYPMGGGVICGNCALTKKQANDTILLLSPLVVEVLTVMANDSYEKVVEKLTQTIPELHQAVMAFEMYHSSRRLPTLTLR